MQQSVFDGMIEMRTIPHSEQRYDTVGDWFANDDGWHIRVSQLGNWRFHFLVALHELVEMAWCVWQGVPQHEVDCFDVEFEANRKPGDNSEPGDHPDAPYRDGHRFASAIERLVSVILGVDWPMYEAAIEALEYPQERPM